MELPRRDRGDERLKPGEALDIRRRLRLVAAKHDLVSVIACAFDHRTRMLPFIYADTRMAPAGVRGIGSSMVDAGFTKTRIVLQQWNKHFRPSLMRVDGRIPDLFMVSSMGLHSDQCMELIRDARTIAPAHRPLIIAGGPHAVYEPYKLFSTDPNNPNGPDVAVTGEEYVLMNLLEVLLDMRGDREPMTSVFERAKSTGALDAIPGLMYAREKSRGVAEELVNTGVQRLLGDLDELPDSVLGYQLLESPSSAATLGSTPVAADRIKKLSPIASVVLTFGCKFNCPYCPIPAYNQRQHRLKSPGRIAEELSRLHQIYGIKYFFGADDNFFNHKQRTIEIVQALADKQINGVPLSKKIRWGTEATIHDTLVMKDHLELVHAAGCRALWLGVEDMTATLVNKGQSVIKTKEAFGLLRDHGIAPMPMMMHHDSQPLWSRGTNYGLLNQIKILRQAGAVSLQVLMMTPSAGTKLFEGAFTEGMVLEKAGGKPADPHMYDGNYVVASSLPRPWRKQLNMLIGYLYFYNPIWLIANLLNKKNRLKDKAAGMQIVGMMGLTQSIRRTSGWALRLMFGKIERVGDVPASAVPTRGCNTEPGSTGGLVQLSVARLVP